MLVVGEWSSDPPGHRALQRLKHSFVRELIDAGLNHASGCEYLPHQLVVARVTAGAEMRGRGGRGWGGSGWARLGRGADSACRTLRTGRRRGRERDAHGITAYGW